MDTAEKKIIIEDLLMEYKGKYSARLGIRLDGKDPKQLFRWLLASILYGAPISAKTAERTYREFMDSGINTPRRIIDAGWDDLVKELDYGGYTRYDFKTADKLLEVSENLLRYYIGDLNLLHDMAVDGEDLKRRVMALGKGVGEVTADIFLRELRGVWPKARPALSPYALKAARKLGLVKKDDDPPLALVRAWGKGLPGKDFRDLEAALVQAGMAMRRKKVA
jgi:endonuclease III